MNACRAKEPMRGSIPLADLGAVAPTEPVVAYDWRSRRFARVEPGGVLPFDLAWQDFSYTVLCPLLDGELALFGDVSKFATMGDRRIARATATPDGVAFEILGVPGTEVAVEGCAPYVPVARAWAPTGSLEARVTAGEDGRFALRLRLGAVGHARVTLTR
jgi:hypothetical protein